jgi:hypothetical protein
MITWRWSGGRGGGFLVLPANPTQARAPRVIGAGAEGEEDINNSTHTQNLQTLHRPTNSAQLEALTPTGWSGEEKDIIPHFKPRTSQQTITDHELWRLVGAGAEGEEEDIGPRRYHLGIRVSDVDDAPSLARQLFRLV